MVTGFEKKECFNRFRKSLVRSTLLVTMRWPTMLRNVLLFAVGCALGPCVYEVQYRLFGLFGEDCASIISRRNSGIRMEPKNIGPRNGKIPAPSNIYLGMLYL